MRCPMCGWSVKENKRIAELEAALAERNEYGYSQQTVDALTAERDKPRAEVSNRTRVENNAYECVKKLEATGCGGLGKPNTLTAMVSEIITRAEKAEAERDGWHKIVQACERVFSCPDTADSYHTSNLANLCRAHANRDRKPHSILTGAS